MLKTEPRPFCTLIATLPGLRCEREIRLASKTPFLATACEASLQEMIAVQRLLRSIRKIDRIKYTNPTWGAGRTRLQQNALMHGHNSHLSL
jgi:hypothetical protein